MASQAVQIVKGTKSPPVTGKHFRVLCMTGESKGTSYFLKEKRVVLGRSETADIKVFDTKASREHAELTKLKDTYIVTDLGSANGIVVNDLKVNQHKLGDGDKIIIGHTVFKFSIIEVKDIVEQISENANKTSGSDEIDDSKPQAKKKSNPKMLILGAIILMAALFLMDDENPEGGSGGAKTSTVKDVSDNFSAMFAKKKDEDDKDVQKKLDAIIHRGQREFREGNYFRAIEEFNLALVLSPNNGRASYYLNKTKQSLDNEIEDQFLKAKRDFDSLKYKSAGSTYCSILRVLDGYQDDERYKRASTQIRNVEKALGMYENEYKCSEK